MLKKVFSSANPSKIFVFLPLLLGGILTNMTPVEAASISFAPTGDQLDDDAILDIATHPGAILSFDVLYDTNGIMTDPPLPFSVEIDFSVILDSQELEFVGSVPDSINVQPIPQNTTGTLFSFQVKALEELPNDGFADISLQLNSAQIGGITGQDVTDSFGGAGIKQTVEVQVPEPSTTIGALISLGIGAWLKKKKR